MSHELNELDEGVTLDTEATVTLEEDRKGCELIDGKWVVNKTIESPLDEDREGCELIDGEWVEKNMSNSAALIGGTLIYAILSVVRTQRLGSVFTESAMYQLFEDQPKRWRRPDISFIASGRLPGNKVPEGKFHIAPDLAGPVISFVS
jgi:Uma2 family endonuclease